MDQMILARHQGMWYEGKVVDVEPAAGATGEARYKIHFQGWNSRWDYWEKQSSGDLMADTEENRAKNMGKGKGKTNANAGKDGAKDAGKDAGKKRPSKDDGKKGGNKKAKTGSKKGGDATDDADARRADPRRAARARAPQVQPLHLVETRAHRRVGEDHTGGQARPSPPIRHRLHDPRAFRIGLQGQGAIARAG